jgi:chaperonin GroEL
MSQARELIFDTQARDKLKIGIETLSNVVSCTLGPKGRNVGLSTSFGAPTITSDGYSIVKEIQVKDQYVNMGIQMGKDMAASMKQTCGDGTTTSIVLLNALTQAGIKLVTAGASPILLKRGMDEACQKVNQRLKEMSQAVSDMDDIQKMAEAASSGNQEIGLMLKEAFTKVGKEGAIIIQEGSFTEDSLELVEGMQIDRGYLSQHFCSKKDKMEVELIKPKVLITDKKIQSIHELLPLLQTIATSGSSLFIIADDIDSEVLAALVINSLRGILKVAPIKAPSFGENKKAILEDIAILTGAMMITEDTGMNLKDVTVEHLGSLEKVVITKDKTLLTQNNQTKDAILKRIRQIDHQIALSSASFDKDKLEERKSKLSGGVAVIHVGAASEVELKKRKQLYQDALSSTKAAVEEGIVIGACMSYLKASSSLHNPLSGDEKIGFDLLIKALKAPAEQIMKNAGFDPFMTLEKLSFEDDTWGLNVIKEKLCDLKKEGIFDSVKVLRHALNLSTSQAGIILLSEALIGNAEE